MYTHVSSIVCSALDRLLIFSNDILFSLPSGVVGFVYIDFSPVMMITHRALFVNK